MKLVVVVSLLLSLLAGCKPAPVVEEKAPAVEQPSSIRVTVSDLTVEPNHKRLDLVWRKAGDGNISGYNIYVSERPLAAAFPDTAFDRSIQPYNPTPFPGDTIPHDGVEHFEADRLDNGVRYFITVRVVYPDGQLSAPTNEVVAVCGGRGEMELAVRHSGGDDGFSFDENRYVPCDDKNSDLYFYSREGRDYLASPNRLDAFVKKTGFVVLPWKGTLREVSTRVVEAKTLTATDQVEVKTGDWVLLRCAPGTQALVKVGEFRGSGQTRRIVLAYAYSSRPGEMFF